MKRINLLLGSLISFFYIYDIGINSLPTLVSSRKIVLFGLIIYFFINKQFIKIDKKFLVFFLIIIFLGIYIFLILFTSNTFSHENSILSRYIYFVLYGLIGSYLIMNIFNSLDTFLNCVKYAGVYQSFIIFCIFSFEAVREFCNNNFINEGNISFLRATDRGTGLGAEGAYLTILLFLSIICCIYFILKKVNIINNILVICILSVASFIVGRTGLYATILIIMYFVVKEIFTKHNLTIKTIIIFLVSIVLIIFSIILVLKLSQSNERIEKIIRVFSGILNFEEGDRSINMLKQMEIPQFNVNFLFGYGIYRGIINGINFQNDMGYIQSYFSMGIIGSVVFYGYILYYLKYCLRKIRSTDKNIYLLLRLLLLVLIVIEIKEPFFIKGITMSFYIIFCYLLEGNKCGQYYK